MLNYQEFIYNNRKYHFSYAYFLENISGLL